MAAHRPHPAATKADARRRGHDGILSRCRSWMQKSAYGQLTNTLLLTRLYFARLVLATPKPLEFFRQQNTFAPCQSTNFIAGSADATAKSSCARPTGAGRSVRTAVPPSWTRSFPPSRPPARAKVPELVLPRRNPAATVAAADAPATEIYDLRYPIYAIFCPQRVNRKFTVDRFPAR